MYRFDLRSMQLLSVIADTGSFLKTADLMNMTPSAVSKRILELESRVNARLAIRTPEGVKLTPAGAAMVRCADDVLSRVSQLSRDIAQTMTGETGEVRVAANTTAFLLGLNAELMQFQRQHPGITVRLVERISADVIAELLAGHIDIGVCAESAAHGGVTSVPYRNSDLIVAVSDTHPLASKEFVRYQDVLEYPNVGRPKGSALLDFSPVQLSEAPTLDVSASVYSFDATIEMVRNGELVAVLPKITLDRRPVLGVRALPLQEASATFKLVLCHDASLVSSPAVLHTFNWLQSQADAATPVAT